MAAIHWLSHLRDGFMLTEDTCKNLPVWWSATRKYACYPLIPLSLSVMDLPCVFFMINAQPRLIPCPIILASFPMLPGSSEFRFIFLVKHFSQPSASDSLLNCGRLFNTCLVQTISLVWMWKFYWCCRTWLVSLNKWFAARACGSTLPGTGGRFKLYTISSSWSFYHSLSLSLWPWSLAYPFPTNRSECVVCEP